MPSLCQNCSLQSTLHVQFLDNGCENCVGQSMVGDSDRVLECTTNDFQGLVTVLNPGSSWTARWLHIGEAPPRCNPYTLPSPVPGCTGTESRLEIGSRITALFIERLFYVNPHSTAKGPTDQRMGPSTLAMHPFCHSGCKCLPAYAVTEAGMGAGCVLRSMPRSALQMLEESEPSV